MTKPTSNPRGRPPKNRAPLFIRIDPSLPPKLRALAKQQQPPISIADLVEKVLTDYVRRAERKASQPAPGTHPTQPASVSAAVHM